MEAHISKKAIEIFKNKDGNKKLLNFLNQRKADKEIIQLKDKSYIVKRIPTRQTYK